LARGRRAEVVCPPTTRSPIPLLTGLDVRQPRWTTHTHTQQQQQQPWGHGSAVSTIIYRHHNPTAAADTTRAGARESPRGGSSRRPGTTEGPTVDRAQPGGCRLLIGQLNRRPAPPRNGRPPRRRFFPPTINLLASTEVLRLILEHSRPVWLVSTSRPKKATLSK